MRGKPPEGSWGTGYIIEPRPNKNRISCSFCKYYNEDGSCMTKPIVISEVGYDYWKYCNAFYLDYDYDTPKNRASVERNKKVRSTYAQQAAATQEKRLQEQLPLKKKYKVTPKVIQLGTGVRVKDITYDEIVLYEIVGSEQHFRVTLKCS